MRVFILLILPGPKFTLSFRFDEPNGEAQELELGSSDDEEEEVPKKSLKSKQKRAKAVDFLSDEESSEGSSHSDSDEERITAANFERKARELDKQAALDAELDAQELREAALAIGSDDEEMVSEGEEDETGQGDGDGLELPTAEEREEERRSGAQDLQVVKHRMEHCARVLTKFSKLGAKGRLVRQSIKFNWISLLSIGHGPSMLNNSLPTSPATMDTTTSWPRNFSIFSLSRKLSTSSTPMSSLDQ